MSLRIASPDYWSSRLCVAVVLVLLAATACVTSQLSLAPSYGAISASVYRRRGVCTILAASNVLVFQNRLVLLKKPLHLLPVQALLITLVHQSLSAGWTQVLGCEVAPLLLESLTVYPLLLVTAIAVAGILVPDSSSNKYKQSYLRTGHATISVILTSLLENIIRDSISRVVGRHWLLSPCGMQLMTVAIYAIVIPSKSMFFILPALCLIAASSSRFPSKSSNISLNKALAEHGFKLLDRRASVTGYISVLENVQDSYRALRCDHSLLGGVWTTRVGQTSVEFSLAQLIFAVFNLLQYVMLMQSAVSKSTLQSHKRTALVM